jgi:hypothetical protein
LLWAEKFERNQVQQSVRLRFVIVAAVVILAACRNDPSSQSNGSDGHGLTGAWRSKIEFQSGPLAGLKDLEFLYAYAAGGTMTESSNYDEAANSSPPAYGVWKALDPRRFETKYIFYTTREPGPEDHAPKSSDWWPAGHGVLTETITMSDDGRTYASTIKLVTFDTAGKPVAGAGGEGRGAGTRITF